MKLDKKDIEYINSLDKRRKRKSFWSKIKTDMKETVIIILPFFFIAGIVKNFFGTSDATFFWMMFIPSIITKQIIRFKRGDFKNITTKKEKQK